MLSLLLAGSPFYDSFLKSAKANFWLTKDKDVLSRRTCAFEPDLAIIVHVHVTPGKSGATCCLCKFYPGNAKFTPLFQRTEHIEGTWWQIMNSFFYSWSHPGPPNRVFSVAPTAGLGSVKKQGCTRGTYNMLALHKMREWAVIPQFKSLISILSCLIGCRAFEQTLT